jgi:NAD(P)-dependent dehydrogenase (short-subunit alcohol dehydrogenase family)
MAKNEPARPHMALGGQVAVVTGAGAGLGQAIARRLATDGADVVIIERDVDSGEAMANEIAGLGVKSSMVELDLSDTKKIGGVVEQIADEFGRIDIWVNNAGVMHTMPMLEMSEEAWDMVQATNSRGLFFASQAVAKQMIKQESGVITNITSGQHCRPNAIHYAVSKMGVDIITMSMALALGQHNIRVNAICPGLFDTPNWWRMDADRARMYGLKPGEATEGWVQAVPSKRLGKPEEVAAMVAFLSSSDAQYVNGQIIDITGGSDLFSYERYQTKGALTK